MIIDLSNIRSEETSVVAGNTGVRYENLPQYVAKSFAKSCIPACFIVPEIEHFGALATSKRRVAQYDCLYQPNDRLDSLYVVRSGHFKMISGDLNRQRVVGLHMTGDMLGLDAIATGRHTVRLVALDDCEVWEIPFAEIVKAMIVEPALQRHFLGAMSEALNNEYIRSSLLLITSLDERFASFLLELGDKYGRIGYSHKSYRLLMSRSDIGSYLGTTIESISRLIARFNARGAVLISGRTVELLDRPYLEAVKCGDHHAGKQERSGHASGTATKVTAPPVDTTVKQGYLSPYEQLHSAICLKLAPTNQSMAVANEQSRF